MEDIDNYNCEGMCAEKHCSNKYTKHTAITHNGLKLFVCLCDKHAGVYEAFENSNEKDFEYFTHPDGEKSVIIKCIKGNDNTWKFFCEFCGVWHTHGAGEGHRCAHCHNSKSPYSGGYYLKLKESNQ